jgi:hypothetical protein
MIRVLPNCRFTLFLPALCLAVPVMAQDGQTASVLAGKQGISTTAPVSSHPQSTPRSKEKARFRLQIISDGILCPIKNRNCANRDIKYKDFSLLATDRHTLHVTSIPFPTVERSREYFQASIKGAEKILRRDPEPDSDENLAGERVLGSFHAERDTQPPSGVPHYRLFWRWGKNFWELSGEHLEDVLDLESELKEEGMNAIWTWGAGVLLVAAQRLVTVDAIKQPAGPPRGRGPFPGYISAADSVGLPITLELVVPTGELSSEGTMLVDFRITNVSPVPIRLPSSGRHANGIEPYSLLTLWLTSDAIIKQYLKDEQSGRLVEIGVVGTSADLYDDGGDADGFAVLPPSASILVHASSRVQLNPGSYSMMGHAELLQISKGASQLMWTADSETVRKTLTKPNR